MAKPSDKEYKLFRKIRELEEQVEKLKKENEILKKKIEKNEPPKEYKKQAKPQGGCPSCGAMIKVTELPHAKLKLCSAACGWRKVE